jgi:hypothetical protein
VSLFLRTLVLIIIGFDEKGYRFVSAGGKGKSEKLKVLNFRFTGVALFAHFGIDSQWFW